jgi:cellulose biosynthesis protein BcsQ
MVTGVIPANEAVAYAHQSHLSIIDYRPKSPAAAAYVKLARTVLKNMYTPQEA